MTQRITDTQLQNAFTRLQEELVKHGRTEKYVLNQGSALYGNQYGIMIEGEHGAQYNPVFQGDLGFTKREAYDGIRYTLWALMAARSWSESK